MAGLDHEPAPWQDARLLRFLIVGAINTALSYAIYALGLRVGLAFPVASLVALVCGLLISFVTQGVFVFASALKGRFPRFLAVWAVIYLVTIAVIWVQTRLGVSDYLAGLLAIPVTAVLSFLLQRRYVFGPDR